MNEETRSRCLKHLREASACLEKTRHAVTAVRLQDLIETIEQESWHDEETIILAEDGIGSDRQC